MDALADLLDGARARGAFLLRAVLDPPWSLRVQDRSPLTVVAQWRGEAWISFDDGGPTRLGPGDVAVVRGPEPYTVADHPSTPPRVVIHPGQRTTTPGGVDLCDDMDLGVRTWGDAADGETVMLVGVYQLAGEVNRRLLDALPRLLVLAADSWDSPVLPLLASEIPRDRPGQDAVLDRLLDLLLIDVLRTWFARGHGEDGPEGGDGDGEPPWLRAHTDPVVGRALRLLHNNPDHPWTVAVLAAHTGVSRAALARRFTDLVGEPPMTYLTGLRLDLAASLLRDERDVTLQAVARRVGYGSAFALSAAFKRVRGVSPAEHRASLSGVA
ncbi:AraC family transcriptional regulator [Frankia sp. CNm7]|uniref:AraC family transcriptional regulator n=1 Tax=Frankia nepalensis TaxID=1836974 RepID=A0A937RMP1_9ACTN|nr:AraC family transcriptional regulator [Frankia nepalensis]MBL7498893.1 AraC family transcriptional regulator [Frankia nepalensis]MBL7512568.1 AraC family transcriptional regulator [Frankia nepalensis]MBL7524255.1 AraC family transcriptional regulator [Frankia nepalensis]MBL7632917.1 AraC family transcriptional regulator [Frankia nepalensis]